MNHLIDYSFVVSIIIVTTFSITFACESSINCKFKCITKTDCQLNQVCTKGICYNCTDLNNCSNEQKCNLDEECPDFFICRSGSCHHQSWLEHNLFPTLLVFYFVIALIVFVVICYRKKFNFSHQDINEPIPIRIDMKNSTRQSTYSSEKATNLPFTIIITPPSPTPSLNNSIESNNENVTVDSLTVNYVPTKKTAV